MEYWPLERAKLNSATPKTLEGNNVIVTGGGGTIGMAIAKKFKQEGANIIRSSANSYSSLGFDA